MINRTGIFATLLFAAISISGATNSGFGLDAFNRSISAATKGNAVFSPVSFELDCVIFSEAFGALTRARFAESMGVLNGLDSVYHPIQEAYANLSGNGAAFLHARAFCLPDERKTHPAYRQFLQRDYSAETFSYDFKKGAEAWFHARMDGLMEDFVLPEKAAGEKSYSFYDLVYFTCSVPEAYSPAMQNLDFHRDDGVIVSVSGMVLSARCDFCVQKNHIVMRIPLLDGMSLFMLVPNEGVSVRDIRGALSSATITDIISGLKSVTEPSVSHEQAEVLIPLVDITSESDLKLPFGYYRFPLTGMERMQAEIQPRHFRQRTRFKFCGNAKKKGSVAIQAVRRMKLTRPFIFFVFHDPTSSIPVSGLYMGR